MAAERISKRMASKAQRIVLYAYSGASPEARQGVSV
jgi:hypothetical protein